jgi:probable F420-dependent oxidoreductase
MTPAFTPTNTEYGAPKVILAAVGPRMTEVAGEVADGMIIHPFSTVEFIESVTLPAIEAGLAKAGKSRQQFEISYSNFVVSGENEEAFVKSKREVCERIAFYGSTPAYRGVLESIGVGELQQDLNAMSKRGRWQEMGTLISDDLLEAFAVVGEPKDIVPEIKRRYAGFVDRTSGSFGFVDQDTRRAMIAELQTD